MQVFSVVLLFLATNLFCQTDQEFLNDIKNKVSKGEFPSQEEKMSLFKIIEKLREERNQKLKTYNEAQYALEDAAKLLPFFCPTCKLHYYDPHICNK